MLDLQREEMQAYENVIGECMQQLDQLKQGIKQREMSQSRVESMLGDFEEENSILVDESMVLRRENSDMLREISHLKTQIAHHIQRTKELEQVGLPRV